VLGALDNAKLGIALVLEGAEGEGKGAKGLLDLAVDGAGGLHLEHVGDLCAAEDGCSRVLGLDLSRTIA